MISIAYATAAAKRFPDGHSYKGHVVSNRERRTYNSETLLSLLCSVDCTVTVLMQDRNSGRMTHRFREREMSDCEHWKRLSYVS